MNPLEWKREHQLALLCAIGLGLALGTSVGIWQVDTCCGRLRVHLWCQGPGDRFCTDFVPVYWLLVGLWGALGGFICALLVYIRQLLRA
jgi:hypothetical protein